jgi:hypothetical protein
MFVVLVGFVAAVTDVGIAFWNRRLLQDAVDSAALAGATRLMPPWSSSTDAINTATAYSNLNGVTNQELSNVTEANFKLQVTSIAVDDNPDHNRPGVIVSARRHDYFGLRYLIGAGNAEIVATAIAIVVPAIPGPGDLLPWALASDPNDPCYASLPSIPPDSPPTNPVICQVHTDPHDPQSPGNFGSVGYPDDPNNGAQAYENDIEYGYGGTVPGPVTTDPATWSWPISTQTGATTGKTRAAIDQIMAWDNAGYCQGGATSCKALYISSPGSSLNPDPYQPQPHDVQGAPPPGTVCVTSTACPRVGIVPILANSTFPNGSSEPVIVKEFQCFYIQSVDSTGKIVTGFFLGTCTPAQPQQSCYNCGDTGLEQVVLWR